jgi:Asp-tRNA(Asn)/Glu-tRNA(Gln) amidotransferase A subunit family amidase
VQCRCDRHVCDGAHRGRTGGAAWATGEPTGSLTGVPVTIKDLLFVAGVPAHAGAPSLADFVPDQDSAAVSALKAAGAVLTCKSTTCESGYKLTVDSGPFRTHGLRFIPKT